MPLSLISLFIYFSETLSFASEEQINEGQQRRCNLTANSPKKERSSEEDERSISANVEVLVVFLSRCLPDVGLFGVTHVAADRELRLRPDSVQPLHFELALKFFPSGVNQAPSR